MRVSSSMLYNNLLKGVANQQAIQDKGNAKIASGTRFQTPAQSGLDYKVSLDLRHSQVGVQSSIDASSLVESRLNISQSLLNDMSNVMKRASVLAVQQGSAQLGPAERQAALQEMNHLANQFLSDSNQQFQGQGLFSGTAVDKPAFTDNGAGVVSYTGSTQDRTVSVSATQQIVSNINGSHVAFANAFTALQSFKTALNNNDQAAIQTALGSLNTAGNGMVDLTADAGARLKAVQISKVAFQDMKLNLDIRLNTHEGVDIPTVVAEMQQSTIALKAAYSQIAQIKSLSLVNFLR